MVVHYSHTPTGLKSIGISMNNYTDQTPHDKCASCAHLYRHDEYDCFTEYYCNYGKNKPTHPREAVMRENLSDREFIKIDNKWYRWANRYSVNPNGICDNYDDGRIEK